jgi:hypothetical protein
MNWVIIFILTITSYVFSQGFQDPFQYPQENIIRGGVGITWIDENPYTTFTITPEFNFGKLGIGLYLQFLLDNNNNYKIRKDEFQDGVGVLRSIQYLRYGYKYDPFFVRVGVLDMAMLGNGFLMWNYNNISNYDKRKLGFSLDVDFDVFGFESVVNNVGKFELAGGNLYLRPFQMFGSTAPIIKNFRIYGTFVHDHELTSPEVPQETKDLEAYGLGADLIFLNTPIIKSGIYYDYGKFIDYGSGSSVGINVFFPEFIGLFSLAAKFEKRFLKDQFIPNFFGPIYELERELNPFLTLEFAEKSEGYFGQLSGHIVRKVRLIGSFARLNTVKRSGILHLEALAPDFIPRFEIRAYYDKTGIETVKDARTLDVRSVATVDVGFRINNYLLLSTIYRWYWVETEDGIYKPVERIEPRLSFSIRF